MKLLTHIPSFLRNKFLLTLLAFVTWMIFFDRNNLILQYSRRQEYKDQLENKAYYQKEISDIQKQTGELSNNAASIEKFAREKYMMKKDNEDVFIVPNKASASEPKK